MKVPIRVACRKSRGREAAPPSLPPADVFLAWPCGFTGQLERTHKVGFLLPAEKESGWAAKPHTATGGQHAEQEEGRAQLPSPGHPGPVARSVA